MLFLYLIIIIILFLFLYVFFYFSHDIKYFICGWLLSLWWRVGNRFKFLGRTIIQFDHASVILEYQLLFHVIIHLLITAILVNFTVSSLQILHGRWVWFVQLFHRALILLCGLHRRSPNSHSFVNINFHSLVFLPVTTTKRWTATLTGAATTRRWHVIILHRSIGLFKFQLKFRGVLLLLLTWGGIWTWVINAVLNVFTWSYRYLFYWWLLNTLVLYVFCWIMQFFICLSRISQVYTHKLIRLDSIVCQWRFLVWLGSLISILSFSYLYFSMWLLIWR